MGIRDLIEQCRQKQQQYERRIPVQLEIPMSGELHEVYREQSDFMLTLRAASEHAWASAEEALEEWRSRTLPDWGVQRDWIAG